MALVAVALALSVHTALFTGAAGDYPEDAGPAIHALLEGNWRAFGQARPAMGSVSLLIRTPFAAIAPGGPQPERGVYHWGALPCMLSLALLALVLAHLAVVPSNVRQA